LKKRKTKKRKRNGMSVLFLGQDRMEYVAQTLVG